MVKVRVLFKTLKKKKSLEAVNQIPGGQRTCQLQRRHMQAQTNNTEPINTAQTGGRGPWERAE